MFCLDVFLLPLILHRNHKVHLPPQQNCPSNSCFLGSWSKNIFLHVLFEFSLPFSTRNLSPPLSSSLFTSSFFSTLLALPDYSLSISFSSSASSLPPYLLIFLSHTVIFSIAVLPFPWNHSSWCSQSQSSPSGESQIYFSPSKCAYHFCSLSCLLSHVFHSQGFLLNQTFSAALKTRWVCRVFSCIPELLVAYNHRKLI